MDGGGGGGEWKVSLVQLIALHCLPQHCTDSCLDMCILGDRLTAVLNPCIFSAAAVPFIKI